MQCTICYVIHVLYTKLFLCSCQTYEGGIAGEPGSEAHGGYVSYFPTVLLSFLFIPLHNYIIWNKKSIYPHDKLSYIFTIFSLSGIPFVD